MIRIILPDSRSDDLFDIKIFIIFENLYLKIFDFKHILRESYGNVLLLFCCVTLKWSITDGRLLGLIFALER